MWHEKLGILLDKERCEEKICENAPYIELSMLLSHRKFQDKQHANFEGYMRRLKI